MYWRPFCLNWNVLKIISLRKLDWFCTYQKTVERQLKKGDGSICNNVNATDNTEISPIACTVETPRSTLAVGRTGKVCRLHTCYAISRLPAQSWDSENAVNNDCFPNSWILLPASPWRCWHNPLRPHTSRLCPESYCRTSRSCCVPTSHPSPPPRWM